VKGTDKPSAKAGKPAATKTEKPKAAKPAKAEKAAKEIAAPPTSKKQEIPPEFGDRLPYKEGSWMRFCLLKAAKPGGIKASVLQKLVEEGLASWKIQLAALRFGQAGRRRPTHKWKLSEEGGVLKVYDITPITDKPKKKAKAAK
jgi:hypothetical protein